MDSRIIAWLTFFVISTLLTIAIFFVGVGVGVGLVVLFDNVPKAEPVVNIYALLVLGANLTLPTLLGWWLVTKLFKIAEISLCGAAALNLLVMAAVYIIGFAWMKVSFW